VLSNLPGWKWVRALFAVYSLIARNRYRIFGKYETCFVPDAALRARVIE
jgi:predicted DCC family thiol-disulfide oxidoreductase YuxK